MGKGKILYRHRKLHQYRRYQHKLKSLALLRQQMFYKNIEYTANQIQELPLADYIRLLTPEQKKQFKMQNPQISQLLFMNQQQKSKYFEQKNQQYLNKLQQQQKRHIKNRKNVKFTEKFQVKYFNKEDSVESVSTQNTEKQNYHFGIHYSC